MESITDAIGQAFASIFDDPIVGLILRLLAAYIVLIWLAAALWAFVDMRRRSSNLIAAYASAALVILATPLLFPAAVLVHVVIRPDAFAADRELGQLRDTAFALEDDPRCVECGRRVEEDWLVCPGCRRQLAHRCHACGRTVGLDWSVCGWCAAELDGEAGRGGLRRSAGA